MNKFNISEREVMLPFVKNICPYEWLGLKKILTTSGLSTIRSQECNLERL